MLSTECLSEQSPIKILGTESSSELSLLDNILRAERVVGGNGAWHLSEPLRK